MNKSNLSEDLAQVRLEMVKQNSCSDNIVGTTIMMMTTFYTIPKI